jgi:DNA-binding SARP family transcriptional activator/tetratricopeptide (TPR) repeat protein
VYLVMLGPVGLYSDGQRLPMARPQQATVLAALAVDAGRLVAIDTLIGRVWDGGAPPAARRSLQAHLARLNRQLPAETLVRHSAGYLLDIDPQAVDVHRFTSLVRAARAEPDDIDRQARMYSEALGLWQGTALAGVPGSWAERTRATWRQQYLEALVGWACAQQKLGHHQEVVDVLVEAVRDDPAAELVVGELMRALHTTGQTADALARFAALREHLADEFGVEPGVAVQRTHLSILRDDVSPPGPQPAGHPVPAGMPPAIPALVGRDGELVRLDALLPDHPLAASRTAVISGMAGVGKTTLAVYWARRVADRYPDGQLYLDLRGFDPRGTAMRPSEAMFALLESLGVEARRIPFSVDGQISLYRSTVAGRRVLILLDNVRDSEHIRALLPGAPGCLVIVTSRSRLTTLVAVEGAHSLTVGPLAEGQVREMLATRLDAARVEAAPAAVERLVAACAGLPLAAALVAARAATHPELDLAELAENLPGGQRLDTFDVGDPALSMRTVFSWSYDALSPAAARMFRLLGLHPGSAITWHSAASLAGRRAAVVREALAELVHTHLLTALSPGRYTMHDLIRAYAVELVHAVEPDAVRLTATHRVLDHLLHTAHAANRLLRPDHSVLSLSAPDPDAVVGAFADDRAAFTWLAAEYPALLAAAVHAGGDPLTRRYTWQLVWCLENFVEWTGRWREFQLVQDAALEAARHDGDAVGEAHTHRGIARTCCRTDRSDDAVEHLRHALGLFTATGSDSGVADTHRSMAVVLHSLGRYEEAVEHQHTSLRLADASDDDAARALAHNNLAFHLALLGKADEAVTHGEQALVILRRIGARNGQARTLSTLGLVYSVLGRHREAIAHYRQSIDIFGALGDRTSQAEMLTRFGDALHASGDLTLARDSWQAALRIFDSLGQFDLLGRYDQIARVRERAQQELRPLSSAGLGH